MATPRVREPAMNTSETVRVGPIMSQFGMSNVKVLPAKLADTVTFELDTDPRGNRKMHVIYEIDNGTRCVASVGFEDGILRCYYCGPISEKVTWCKHIHELVLTRNDHPLFTETGRYLIPLTPTEGIYVPVHLEMAKIGTTNSQDFYRVGVKVAQRDEKGNPGVEFNDICIGYVPKGCVCTADLRSVLSQWLAGNMSDTRYYAPVKCQGLSHNDNTRHSVFTNMFYEAMYGLCLDCVLKMYTQMEEHKSKKKIFQADAPDF